MAYSSKAICALLLLAAHVIKGSRGLMREKQAMPRPVNDTLPFFEFVVASGLGEVLATANASIVDSNGTLRELKGDRFWVELDEKLALPDCLPNAPDEAGNLDTTDAKCRGLTVTINPPNSRGSSQMEIEGAPVIHDIRLDADTVEHVSNVDAHHKSHPFYGVLLAVIAAGLVGASFIFQKKALLKTEARKTKTSFVHKGSCGEFAYLKQCVWWCGMLSMAVGEVLTFVAYSIAPAILITPLGALRVIVSAVLSSVFLGERLNSLGKIGIVLSLLGSVMIVIHAPRSEKVKTFEQVVLHFTDSKFLMYCFVLVAATIFLIVHVAPRHGRTNVMVYISVCNIVGALCVLCGKGLGISIKEIGQHGDLVYLNPIFWLLVLVNIVGIVTQIVYLNKALMVFDTSLITPLKYVFTNVFLVFGSILLFQEFAFMSVEDVIGITCGFATVVVGVVLLNLFKDGTYRDVTPTKR